MQTPLNTAAIDAVIVDLDGTISDTLADFDAAIGGMLADLGLREPDPGFLLRKIGKGSEHLVRETLAHCGGTSGHYEAAWTAYQAHYAEVNGRHARVYDGVAEGLDHMRARGWRLACVTNKPLRFAQALLALHGLADHFEVVYGGDSFDRKKPDPLPLLEACRALGSEPARTLVVGDSSNDAQAARAAGCPVVLVTYGYNHGEPIEAAGADALVDRIDAIGVL